MEEKLGEKIIAELFKGEIIKSPVIKRTAFTDCYKLIKQKILLIKTFITLLCQ